MPLSVFVLSFGIAGATLAGVPGHSTVPGSAEKAPVLADSNCAGYCVNDWDDDWPHRWHQRWDRPDYNGYDYNRHDHNSYNRGIIVFND